mmetsp:Transcript_21376/g.52321  ORF Transcript_21376/g.52321 Transcript_21376/m.52321 type:complete len:106 (-) Transcript_21376:91-408(-)
MPFFRTSAHPSLSLPFLTTPHPHDTRKPSKQVSTTISSNTGRQRDRQTDSDADKIWNLYGGGSRAGELMKTDKHHTQKKQQREKGRKYRQTDKANGQSTPRIRGR